MELSEGVARTYRLAPAVIERIDVQAKRWQTGPSMIVNILLTRALDELESGRWQPRQTPVAFHLAWSAQAKPEQDNA